MEEIKKLEKAIDDYIRIYQDELNDLNMVLLDLKNAIDDFGEIGKELKKPDCLKTTEELEADKAVDEVNAELADVKFDEDGNALLPDDDPGHQAQKEGENL